MITIFATNKVKNSQVKNINENKLSNQTSLFNEDRNEKNHFEYVRTQKWTKKELLREEFKSLGFYISDHPLNEYKDVFDQLKIISFKNFISESGNEALVAGTIMSFQEKKSAKGTPFAIVKFSDNEGEFELFLFAEYVGFSHVLDGDRALHAKMFWQEGQATSRSQSSCLHIPVMWIASWHRLRLLGRASWVQRSRGQ